MKRRPSRRAGQAQKDVKARHKREVGARLQLARRTLKLTQRAFAEAIGASLQTIKSYEGGRRIPSGGPSERLARLGINLTWLFRGEGSMLLEGDLRRSQIDMVAAVGGDSGAEKRLHLRGRIATDRLALAFNLVDDAARHRKHPVPPLVRQAIVLAVVKGMALDGVELLLDLLEAQLMITAQERRP